MKNLLFLMIIVSLASPTISVGAGSYPSCTSSTPRDEICFAEIVTPKGDSYTGGFRNGQPHGEGRYSWGPEATHPGDNYEGSWEDGIRHGYGTYTHANGDVYKGRYKNGLPHGKGRYEIGDGVYEGDFIDGKNHGYGTYTRGDQKYVGEWRNGKSNGFGTEIFPDGGSYTGEYKDSKFDGAGTFIFSDGSKYVGQWKDGKYHGWGTFTKTNGRTWTGKWRDGEILEELQEASKRENAAEKAVNAAKELCRGGQTINVLWEAGLQALDPILFSGPKWTEKTGCKVNVVEVSTAQMFTKIAQDFQDGTGLFDVVNVIPSWIPELVQMGAIEQLDAFIDAYGYRSEYQGIAQGYRNKQGVSSGKIYGLPDDGDVFILYYRKDIFEREDVKAAFRKEFERGLSIPYTWDDFIEVGQFLSSFLEKEGIYGASMFRHPGYGNFMFQERFRNEGGKFFDENMNATINSRAGVKVFNDWLTENKFMARGVEQFGFIDNLAEFVQGKSAMTISWPLYGRLAAGYLENEETLNWVPKTQIAGKIGYALPPGGHPQLAAGYALSVTSRSKNKEAAYLFIQWLNSEEISNQRVQLPYALRDPFRNSHFENEGYKALWPDAKDYLSTLKAAAANSLADLSLIQNDKYEESLRQGIARLWSGGDPQRILDEVAREWDKITNKVGKERQYVVYSDWKTRESAHPSSPTYVNPKNSEDNKNTVSNIESEKTLEAEITNRSNLPNCPSNISFTQWNNCFSKYDFASGDSYEGEWVNGKFNGRGTYISNNINFKYVGEFKNDDFHGQGTAFFSNGDKYVGEFRLNQRTGYGTIFYKSGNKYVGEFQDAELKGQGTFYFANGDKYVGGFDKSKQHGQGIYTFGASHQFLPNYVVYGEWNTGETVLPHRFVSPEGVTIVGHYENGKIIPEGQTNTSQEAQPAKQDDTLTEVSSGSGFAVAKDGYVITNNHVIEGCQEVTLHNRGDSIPAKLVTFDAKNDLALLKADFTPQHVFPIRQTDVSLLEDIYVAGFPFGDAYSTAIKVTKGIVSALAGPENDFSLVQIDAALQSGSSGGPIVDEKGNLVAVTVAKLDMKYSLENFGEIPENINFGIKSSVVRNILSSHQVNFITENTSTIAKRDLGANINNGTYYVSCWATAAESEATQESNN